MTYDAGGPICGVTAKVASGFAPPPLGQYQLGMLAAFGIQDVGANYTGDCQDVTATESVRMLLTATPIALGMKTPPRAGGLFKHPQQGLLLSVSFEHNLPVASNTGNPVPALADWALSLITLSIVTVACVVAEALIRATTPRQRSSWPLFGSPDTGLRNPENENKEGDVCKLKLGVRQA